VRGSVGDRVQAREVPLEAQGKPGKHWQISLSCRLPRHAAIGALALTGIPAIKEMFEPQPGGWSAKTPTSTAQQMKWVRGSGHDLDAFK